MEIISLDDFAGGALKERVNQAILQVLENIADPNTSVKLKRKVTVDITFEANESREMAQVSWKVASKELNNKNLGGKENVIKRSN